MTAWADYGKPKHLKEYEKVTEKFSGVLDEVKPLAKTSRYALIAFGIAAIATAISAVVWAGVGVRMLFAG